MKEIEFNLLTEPWIRVRLRDNTVREVSLTEALVSAQDYVDLAGEMPTQNAAVLRLFPKPKARATVLAGLSDPHQVLALFRRLRAVAGDALTGFEMMPDVGMEMVLKQMKATKNNNEFFEMMRRGG